MSDQKLNNRELLNVRWAFDDPNPKARKEVNNLVTLLLIYSRKIKQTLCNSVD